MRRRVRTLLLTVMMVVSFSLASCGTRIPAGQQDIPTAPDGTNSAEQTNAAAPAAYTGDLKPARLVMIFMGAMPKDMPEVQAAISKYLTEKINATIDIRPIDWGNYRDKTNLMFASSEQIDLMFTSSWMYLGDEVAKGQILELDELIGKYGPDIEATLDPDVVEGGKINNRIWAVATNKEFASDKGLMLRRDLVDKYRFDLSALKELKDFEPLFKTIRDNEPGMIPLQVKNIESPLTSTLGYGFFDMLGDGPGVLDRSSKEYKVINMFETPVYMDYAKLMRSWFLAGYINKDGSSNTEMTYSAVKAGKAFSYAQSGKPGIEAQEQRNTGYEMVYVPVTKPYMTTGDTTSAMFAIPASSVDPARAMMFINMLFSDKYLLNLLNWGIEGRHYVKVSDNVIDYPKGVDASNTGYSLNMSWMFGNQMNNYLWTYEDPKLWEKLKEFNTAAERSIALGFVFFPEKVKSEIAAINNVNAQFQGAINSGALEPEKIIPQYNARLREAGLDKVIAEKQAQLDAWVQANKK